MLPKTEVPETIQQVAAQLGPNGWVLPLIESLAGLDAVNSLVRESRVLRLAFGHLDFQLDLGMKCHPDEPELDGVRFALVAASRRACLPAPIDSITADIGNAERLAFDTARARALGFGGKLCIHPSQANIVNQGFLPSAGEVNWARKVLAMAARTGAEAFSLDARMVDKPVIRMAEKILSAAACQLNS